jgi:hypothetical protein
MTSSRSVASASSERSSTPSPASGTAIAGDALVGADVDAERGRHPRRGLRGLAEAIDPAPHGGRGDVVGLHGDDRGTAAARERVLRLLERLHRGEVLRQRAHALLAQVEAGDRGGEREQQRGRRDRRDERAAQHAGEHGVPDAAAVAGADVAAPHERQAAALDAVAELRQQRGQHGHRPDHRDRDDDDDRDGVRGVPLVLGGEHAGHRRHDREARHQDGAPRRRRGGLERGLGGAAGGALLALAAQVEEGVVDPDREADEEDDRGGRLLDRERLARQRDEPHPGGDRGEPEQDGDARRDERAEREEEDRERDRDAEELGLLEVALHRVVVGLHDRAVAGLLDPHAEVRGARVVERGGDRLDGLAGLLDVAPELELDERGAQVAADLRLADDRDLVAPQRRGRMSPIASLTIGEWTVLPLGAVTRMLSVAASRRPDSWSARSARPDSPVPFSWVWSVCVPIEPPIPTARTTKRSHPTIARRRCWADQRPALEAMLTVGMSAWCAASKLRASGEPLHLPPEHPYSARRSRTIRQVEEQTHVRLSAVLREDPVADVRREAARALGAAAQEGHDVVAPLVAALSDRNDGVRRAATLSLGRSADPRAVEILVRTLAEQPVLWEEASAALATAGDGSTVDLLLPLVEHESTQVRRGALRAVAALSQREDARPARDEPLFAYTDDEGLSHPLF